MNLNQQLSEHFTLRECIKSATAARLEIDNTPPEEYILKLKFLCLNILEPIRNYYQIPFSPNSVYRCLELNRALKSNDNSQHPKAEAADIEIPGISNYDLATWIKNHLNFDQLILECYEIGVPNSGWVHVSTKISENRNKTLTYTKNQYLYGLVR